MKINYVLWDTKKKQTSNNISGIKSINRGELSIKVSNLSLVWVNRSRSPVTKTGKCWKIRRQMHFLIIWRTEVYRDSPSSARRWKRRRIIVPSKLDHIPVIWHTITALITIINFWNMILQASNTQILASMAALKLSLRGCAPCTTVYPVAIAWAWTYIWISQRLCCACCLVQSYPSNLPISY